jgi:tripartite-type tricarboxylate transporter receptor subunit TctC
MFNTMAGVLQQARSGQLRGLAVTTAKRFPTAPEFPTVAESVPGFDVSSWYAFLVPVKTPAEIVKKLHADTVAILREPAIKSKLEQVGVMAIGSTPKELAVQLKSETEMWGPVIKAAGIKPEG